MLNIKMKQNTEEYDRYFTYWCLKTMQVMLYWWTVILRDALLVWREG